MLPFLLFIIGLVIGSFLNVVSLRYSGDKSIFGAHLGGRSRCQHCYQQLRWYELIPIFSFLLQKGRCWVCYKKLSWQYILVEIASGLIFLLPVYFWQQLRLEPYVLIQSFIWIPVFLTFLLIWAIDFRLYLIPDELNLILIGLGFIFIDYQNLYHRLGFGFGSFLRGYADIFGWQENIWLNHLAAAFIGAAIVGLIIFLTRGKGMGMGDLKLLAALGFLFGWPDVLFIFFLSSIIGAAVSLVLMAFGKKNMTSHIPFGPFLVLSAAIIFFFGHSLLYYYFRFFGW